MGEALMPRRGGASGWKMPLDEAHVKKHNGQPDSDGCYRCTITLYPEELHNYKYLMVVSHVFRLVLFHDMTTGWCGVTAANGDCYSFLYPETRYPNPDRPSETFWDVLYDFVDGTFVDTACFTDNSQGVLNEEWRMEFITGEDLSTSPLIIEFSTWDEVTDPNDLADIDDDLLQVHIWK